MMDIIVVHEKSPCNKVRLLQSITELDAYMIPTISSRKNVKQYVDKLARFADVFYLIKEGKECGSCAVYMNTDISYISSIGILPEFHGQGLGSILLNTVIKESESKSKKAIKLDVYQENRSAYLFYRRNGFKEEESKGSWITMYKEVLI